MAKESWYTIRAERLARLQANIDALREEAKLRDRLIDARFLSAEKAVQAAFLSNDKAITKAEDSTNRRLESMNEFRLALADQAKTYLTRQEYEPNHKNLEDKIDSIADRLNRDEGEGRGKQDAAERSQRVIVFSVATLFTLVNTIIAVAVLVLH